jgi:hypothetical protein
MKTILLIISAYIIFYIVYAVYRENRAPVEATTFCNQIKPGTKKDEVKKLAAKNNAESNLHYQNENKMVAIFVGAPPFSRYMCEITIQGDQVISAVKHHLD